MITPSSSGELLVRLTYGASLQVADEFTDAPHAVRHG